MGTHPTSSAVNPDSETWEVPNLYICDTSVFPTSSGANPMITCEAVAHLIASRLRDKLMGEKKGTGVSSSSIAPAGRPLRSSL